MATVVASAEASVQGSTRTYRLILDDRSTSARSAYTVEEQRRDTLGAARWEVVGTLATHDADGTDSGVPAKILAALIDKLTGRRLASS